MTTGEYARNNYGVGGSGGRGRAAERTKERGGRSAGSVLARESRDPGWMCLANGCGAPAKERGTGVEESEEGRKEPAPEPPHPARINIAGDALDCLTSGVARSPERRARIVEFWVRILAGVDRILEIG